MNCERVSQMLEDLLDDELGASERRDVESHVAGCEACAALHASLVREQQVYAEYDRGFEPGENMWKAVLARIEEEPCPTPGRPSGSWSPLEWLHSLVAMPRFVPAAVALCALVVTGVVAYRIASRAPIETTGGGMVVEPGYKPDPFGGGNAPTTTEPSTSKGSEKPEPPTSRKPSRAPRTEVSKPDVSKLPATVVDAERDYLKAIASLTKDVDRGRGSVDPVLRNEFEKPLVDIDRNIAMARDAVRKNPNDPTAVLNMFAAYDNKVDVLQQLASYQVAQNR